MLNDEIKIDLHIHSSASEYKDGSIVANSNINNTNVLIDKLEENGINLFSITDHNRFDYALYEKLKAEIKKSQIIRHILPGVEFDVKLDDEKDRCHVIAIFDDVDDKKIKNISKVLEKNGFLSKSDYYNIEQFEKIIREIDLKTCLIVHQRQGFKGSIGKTNSLSNSTDDPSYFIKVGFIDSLEYNTPRVEGIVKNSLRNINVDFPLITGSDCHSWNDYPYRDKSNNINRDFTKFKSLPTFKGLSLSLTSFSSRVHRSVNNNENHINSLWINDREIQLSKGINAIIGDNGSGKSLLANLLSGTEIKNYYKDLITKNNLKVNKSSTLLNDQVLYIDQGEIVKKVRDGNLFDNSNSEYYSKINNNSIFTKNIEDYFDNLIIHIQSNISKNKKKHKMFQSNVEIKITSGEYHFPIVDSSININDNSNIKERLDKLEEIKLSLEKEIDDNSEFYGKYVIYKDLNSLLLELNKVVEKLNIKYIELENDKKIRQLIKKKLDNYNTKLTSNRTSKEKDKIQTRNNYNSFKESILEFIKESNKLSNAPKFPNRIEGISEKSKGSYNFKKTARYNNVNVKDDFYKNLFNKGYDEEDVINISTEEEFNKALSNYTMEQLEEFKNTKLKKFIESWVSETTTISEVEIGTKIGNTPGEISLVYYKFITSEMEEDYEVVVIDQPEDDINPKRINEFLLDYLSKIRDNKQIFIVTHNPMIVVNLDVDNVIYVNKTNNNLEIKYGCLEYDSRYVEMTENDYSILDIVKQNLDGGYEVIERRLNSYDRD